MTDIIKSENNVPIRFADMGDGTFAEVIAANTFTYGAKFNVFGAGKSLSSSGASVSTLLPFDSTSFLAPSCVRVAVTAPGYIRIQNTESAASSTDILVNPADSLLVDTTGKQFISFVSLTGDATANIQPVGSGSFEIFPATLDLNFASNTYKINGDSVPLSNIVTFSRNSSASFVDVDGLIKYVTANEIRIDRNPLTGVSRGILIEEQRTNLLTFSEQFDNAVWVKNAATVSVNATAAPSGSSSADKLIADTSNVNAHAASQNISFTSGVNYALTVFAKAGEYGYVNLVLPSSAFGGVNQIGTFDLFTGAAIVSVGSPAVSIVSAGNGWYRCAIAATATVTTTGDAAIRVNSTFSNAAFAGDGTSGIFIWGGQLEAGAFPTSYIPTTTAQATRLADSASIAGTNFTNLFSQGNGTLFVDLGLLAARTTDCTFFRVDDGTSSNRINVGTGASFVNMNSFVITAGASQGANVVAVSPLSINRCAFAFAQNSSVSSANGTVGSTDTSVSMPLNLNRMLIGRDDTVGFLNGSIERIMYIPRRLSNTELQAITI